MPPNKPSILLAEDEPITRRAIHSALLEMGFVVHPAKDGDEGCALIDELKGHGPQLLITDIEMPGCGGEELAQYARQHCGQIKVLFLSGAPQLDLVKSISADPDAGFLMKPFLPANLLAAIRKLGITPALS